MSEEAPEKSSDIPELPVLAFLAAHVGRWATWGVGYTMVTVQDAMPAGTPEKLQLSKMRRLMKRGLVDGCGCGCRGDFEITQQGLEHLRDLNRELSRAGIKEPALSRPPKVGSG